MPTLWLLIAGSRVPSAWFQAEGDKLANHGAEYLDGSPFDRNVYLGILVLALIIVASRGSKVKRILTENMPLVAFVMYCAVSLCWSQYPDVGFKRWTKLLGDLSMALIVITDENPTAAMDRLLTRLGFLIVPLSMLLMWFYPGLGRVYDITGTKVGFTGVTTDKNVLGMICMLISIGAFWRVVREWGDRRTSRRAGPLLANLVLLTGSVYLLFQADSATSESCFLLCSGLILVIKFSPKAGKAMSVHVSVAGALGLAVFALFFAQSLLGAVGRNSTLTGRTELWTVVLSQQANRLLGAGYESFWLGDRLVRIWLMTGQRAVQAHDGYIEILLNLGWIGALLFASIIILGYRKISQNVSRSPKTECLGLAYFVAALIYNFTEAGFKMTDPVWIFFVWAVMAASLKPKSTVQPEPVVRLRNSEEWFAASYAR